MKLRYLSTAVVMMGLFGGCAEHEGHSSHAALMAEAKISEADARKIAMDKVPNGTIKEAELEREHGHLQWSFDMKTPDTKDTTEVNVDAITGQIISVEKENAKAEASEKKAEKEEKE